jgi:dihydrofolate reductase
MTADASRVTIHMVSSLDFFIARKDRSVSWLESSDSYAKGVSGEDAEDFLRTIDCFVMGSRTYELALTLGWPYGDLPVIVLTHRNLPTEKKSVEFYSGNLNTLVSDRLKPRYKSIWVVGGAMVARDFLRLKLANDIRIAIMPVMLGDGTPFVDHIGHEQALHLKDVTAYKDGMVELWYEIRNE